MDLSPQNFAKLFDQAVGFPLRPPFDPYANSLNYLLAAYVIPYVGLVGYVGTIPGLTYNTTRLVSAPQLNNLFPLHQQFSQKIHYIHHEYDIYIHIF